MLLTGCAGREANPIVIYMPGDEKRSCTALHAEMAQLQAEMQRMLPKTDKGLSNALWATAGVFLIVPFFFMDFKDAERIEFNALRQRYNRLLVYAAEKECDLGNLRQERILSIKEVKNDEIIGDEGAFFPCISEPKGYNCNCWGYLKNERMG